MTQKYYVYVKSSHVGAAVYPETWSLGELVKNILDADWCDDSFTRYFDNFDDPSLVILHETNPKKVKKDVITETPAKRKIRGEFIIIGSNETRKEPKCLTWGQCIACLKVMTFSPERPAILELEADK